MADSSTDTETSADLNDYERARVMFPDYMGLARGKYLPTHLAPKGTGHCVTMYGLGYDRSMVPAPGSYLLEGLIDLHATMDPDTVRPGWEDDRTAVAVADLALHGEPFPYSARQVLKNAVAAWEGHGLSPKVGIELEGYLMEPDPAAPTGERGAAAWRRYANPRAMVYGTGPANDPTGVIDDIMTMSRRCGFRVESINAEYDESQYELTLEYGDALATADEIFLFKVMARELALTKGLDFTFLGKPYAEISGSGLHVNVSLTNGAGDNTLSDGAAEDGLSMLARHSLAGLCHHHRALTTLLAPNVNAYRRLQPAQLSGYWANWGYDHRCVANRVPDVRGAGTRIENRIGDGAANVHVAIAAVLTAMRLGVEGEMECPPAETGDGFEEVNTDVCAPADLSEALDALEADTTFVDALGPELVANLVANKRAEWDRFIEAEGSFDGEAPPTPWELNEYLMYH